MPFGELRFGDERGLEEWKLAHHARHLTYQRAASLTAALVQAVDLTGPIDESWFAWNMLLHEKLNRMTPGSSLLPTVLGDGWSDANSFDEYHRVHNLIHQRLDQAFGVVQA